MTNAPLGGLKLVAELRFSADVAERQWTPRAETTKEARQLGQPRERGKRIVLILTRKVGESIMIGEAVEVKVLGLRAGQVKIGIEAPRDLRVHREEIFERIRAEQENENQVVNE